jgi:hypothetical protein
MTSKSIPYNLNEIVNNHVSSLATLYKYKDQVFKDICYYGDIINDFYHLLEFGSFPAHIQSKIYKQFTQCLKERRRLKDTMWCLRAMEHKIKRYGFKAGLSKVRTGTLIYKPRVLVDVYTEYRKYIPPETNINLQKEES